MRKDLTNKYAITTGIGLQDVDKLKNSSYFINETNKYIKGEITLDELENIVSSYYKSKPVVEERSEEADKISIRIARMISEDSFSFTVGQLLSIHKNLFEGILPHPGEMRTYNFSKKEWVLNGDTVSYCDYRDLETTLNYDFEQESKFSYKGLEMDETINHLSLFISNLWQIHPFEEGNTRTAAVFLIKYLRTLGFDATNDTFAKNAWYFRNSLVRANYTNIPKGVFSDCSYLNKFLRNLLLNEKNVLHNRELRATNEPITVNQTKESKVISLIRNDSTITSLAISKELGVSLRTTKSILKLLSDNKKIRRVNGKRYGHWEII